MPQPMRWFCLCLVAWAVTASSVLARDRTLTNFTNPLTFTYGTWQHVARVEADRLIIDAANGQGGAGYTTARDLSRFADRVPVLTLTIRPDNRARSIRLTLRDGEERAGTWRYDLAGEPTGRPIQLRPTDAAPLGRPDDPARPIALDKITQLHIVGDSGQENVSVELDQIVLPVARSRQDQPATQPAATQPATERP